MKPLELQDHCHDCGATFGEVHEGGCDVDICPFCGVQMLQDECKYLYFGIEPDTMEQRFPWIYANGLTDEMADLYEQHLEPHLLKWDGVFPGIRECREYGFWCKWENGWRPCAESDPAATEDLNTLAERTVWDEVQKRRVLKEEVKSDTV